MNLTFVNAFQSEWLKKKRSLASWLVVIGGFFTPAIVIVARLLNHDKLAAIYSSNGFWNQLWKNSWESMAIFFLPMGAILATSLITQIEYKNNAWKQVHALPLSLTTIFFSKLAVILAMMVQFFVLFNLGIYLSAALPYLLVGTVPYPDRAIPYLHFLKENLLYFVDCLPIVALQYLISLRFKNFLVPIGVGFLAWVGALASLSWKFGFVIPYTYCMLNYLKDDPTGKAVIPSVDIHSLAIGYFLLFTVLGYCLFVTKTEKG
jgi:lantibiotic transport system permease protein